MPTFTSLSDILNLATNETNDQRLYVGHKQTTKNGGLSFVQEPASWHDTWGRDGRTPNGTVPTSAAAPTSATQGAIEFENATSGFTKYLIEFGALGDPSEGCQHVLYDRLLHISGLDGTVTSAQTVGGSLTRNTTGEGNEIWVVFYTGVGATAATITASYTNQANTSGRTTKAVTFNVRGNEDDFTMFSLPLQDGDSGVRAVASVTLSASTGTAGDFGIVVARPLAVAHLDFAEGPDGSGYSFNTLHGINSPIALEDNACLAVASSTVNTTEEELSFWLYTLEKED